MIEQEDYSKEGTAPNWPSDTRDISAYKARLRQHPILSEGEARNLIARIQAGTEYNLRLNLNSGRRGEYVRMPKTRDSDASDSLKEFTRDYQMAIFNRIRHLSVLLGAYRLNRDEIFLDLAQEGNMIVVNATDHFDLSAENKVSTYVFSSLDKGLRKALEVNGFMRKDGGEVVHVRDPKDLEKMAVVKTASVTLPERIRGRFAEFPGYNTNSGRRIKGRSTGELIGINYLESPTDLERRELAERRRDLVQSLVDSIEAERNREIIISRYGLCGRAKATLRDIGKRFGITRERIRQVEEESLGRLKFMAPKDTADYINDGEEYALVESEG